MILSQAVIAVRLLEVEGDVSIERRDRSTAEPKSRTAEMTHKRQSSSAATHRVYSLQPTECDVNSSASHDGVATIRHGDRLTIGQREHDCVRVLGWQWLTDVAGCSRGAVVRDGRHRIGCGEFKGLSWCRDGGLGRNAVQSGLVYG